MLNILVWVWLLCAHNMCPWVVGFRLMCFFFNSRQSGAWDKHGLQAGKGETPTNRRTWMLATTCQKGWQRKKNGVMLKYGRYGRYTKSTRRRAVSECGARTALVRFPRDAWSMVKPRKQEIYEYAPPPVPNPIRRLSCCNRCRRSYPTTVCSVGFPRPVGGSSTDRQPSDMIWPIRWVTYFIPTR